MSNVYAAYGPVPTSIGVTATPRLNGSLDRRSIALGRSTTLLDRSATLGRASCPAVPRYPPAGMACSYQDLRRSREFLEMRHGPMEPLQSLETMSMSGGMIHGSLDSFPTLPTSTLERRRNGGVVTACSVHGGGGTLSRAGSRRGSLGGSSLYELAEEPRGGGGCCGRNCCTLTLSILACLLILSGVIVALYFFITSMSSAPFSHPPIPLTPSLLSPLHRISPVVSLLLSLSVGILFHLVYPLQHNISSLVLMYTFLLCIVASLCHAEHPRRHAYFLLLSLAVSLSYQHKALLT